MEGYIGTIPRSSFFLKNKDSVLVVAFRSLLGFRRFAAHSSHYRPTSRSMLSETPNNSARYMRLTALFLLSHALLLIGEGSWMMLNHKPHVPHYHNHHVHDACHSLAFVLGGLLIFYTIAVLLIALTKYARKDPLIANPISPTSQYYRYRPPIISNVCFGYNSTEKRDQNNGPSEYWVSPT